MTAIGQDPPRSSARALNVNPFALSSRSYIVLGVAVLIGGLAGGIGSLFMQKIYRAQVLLAVVDPEASSAGASIMQSLGGLGALAGLPFGGADDRRARSVAFLKSRELTSRFIAKQELGPYLYPEKWDAGAKSWRTSASPTEQDLFNRFDREIREVREDKLTGLITLTIDWTDRERVAAWANALVKQANEELRAKALAEARHSIDFLQRELDQASVLELRQSVYKALEAQINSVMLANVREDYAFQMIDSAVTPDANKFVRPRPIVVVALGMLAGLALAVCALALADFRQARLDGTCA